MSAPADEKPPEVDDGLLESFLAGIVVDEYAAVPVRSESDTGGKRWWTVAAVTLLIGVMLATGLVNTLRSGAERQQTRDALLTRITALSDGVVEGQALVDEQAATVEALQSTLLESSAAGQDVGRLERLSELASATPLTGPGLVVSIGDAPDATAGSLNRVLDRDLQDITNVLWQMGAAGIAINEQRLTSTSAIRGAGDAILVNYQPLSPPYSVSAIGTTTSGEDDSGLQVLLKGLTDDYGLVTDITTGDVALPAGEVRYPRFATTGNGDVGQ